jgi:chemotaxis family two-component system response regulator Rcp1
MLLKPITILLAEDNPGDARLTMEAFKEGKIYCDIHIAEDGEKAISFLQQKDEYKDAPRPDLILLDLNMPKKNGREVLKEIKQDPDLCRIPVIILTTSRAEEDILETYDLHANCYISKPVGLDEFVNVAQGIENFWLTIVRLPP